MFGLPMRASTRTGEVVEMKPISTDQAEELAAGFSSYPVVKTLTLRSAQTVEGEQEWIKRAGSEATSCGWGIYFDGELVGNTGFTGINDRRASSGCCIFKPELWGKGLITAVHHARMHYAVQVLGLEAVDSQVYAGNDASVRALERVGYTAYGTRFNVGFLDGEPRHATQLLWVNPNHHSWQSFWRGGIPADHQPAFAAGRKNAQEALRWAADNVMWL